MTPAVESLYQRLREFSPGDVVEASEILEVLEKTIVAEGTDFDDAAWLSRTLDEFSALVKAGVAADWESFRQGLPSTPAPAVAPQAPVAPVAPMPAPAAAATPGAEESFDVDVEVLASFLSEAQDHLETIEGRILSLEDDPDPKIVNEIFRSVHTIKGVAGFLNLSQIKKLAHELEFLLDELRSLKRTVDRSLIDILLLGTDTLGQLVHHVARRASELKVEKGLARITLHAPPIDEVLGAIARIRGTPGAPPAPAPAAEPADLIRSPELIVKFSQEALETIELVERCFLAMEKAKAPGDDLPEAFRSVHTLKGNAGFFGFGALEALCMDLESVLDALRKGQRAVDAATTEALLGSVDKLRALVQAVGAAPPTPAAGEPRIPGGTEAPKGESEALGRYALKKKDVRVDTDKLDALFDLIGELITAEAMVIDTPDLRGLELETFPRAAAYLSKITRELQAVTMSIRMIPLEGLFSKMNRLVRDLGRKFSKDITLEITGAETEMDRNIIEEISDPLVHIIRNALDHGIEDDATRRARGKTPGGTIRLNARYEGNEIWITVSDDGAGLDRDRILEVARNKGLPGDSSWADEDVWKLIFEPGFSTAKQVSEISGRGVGMDVVKRNVEKLRGQIDIKSVRDQGTDFVLKIPLTLAIIDGVTLRSGSTLYSIPIADVVEFQNYQADRVTQTDPGHRVLRLRDEVMPILPLTEIFVPAQGGTELLDAKKVSIVVKSRHRKMALVVDEIVGYKQIVLKALPETMAGLEGISGCTILGNGEVSLIIDVNSVFSRYLA